MKIKLTLDVVNAYSTYEMESGTDITIGREVDNKIKVLADGVSRHHAKISFKDDAWFVEDLGSTNGSFIRGAKIAAPVKLVDGDLLRFGIAALLVRIDAPVKPAPAAVPAPAPAPAPVKPVIPVKPVAPVKPVVPVQPVKMEPVMMEPVEMTPVEMTPVEMTPVEMTPVELPKPAAPAVPARPTLPKRPVLPTRPTLPGKAAAPANGLRPGLKLPTVGGNGLKPGLKLPTMNNTLKPGLKLPTK